MKVNSVRKLLNPELSLMEERIATLLVSNFLHAENHGSVCNSNLLLFISILQSAIHLRNRLWLTKAPKYQAHPDPYSSFPQQCQLFGYQKFTTTVENF